jgi:predicted PurR-regulated permease PerM
MNREPSLASWQRVGSILTVVAVVAALYFGKSLFVPFALAGLLCLLLAPLVHALERLKIGRVAAVVLTTIVASSGIAALGWVVWGQMGDLAEKVDAYKENIWAKLERVRGAGETPIAKIEKSLAEAAETEEAKEKREEAASRPPTPGESLRGIEEKPVPVEVVARRPGVVGFLRDVFGPLLAPLGTAAVVFVLTVFMLLYREDLRDRFIRLVSRGQIVVTTQALAEASERISRYLATTLVVNALYGVPIGIGLYVLGVPNAVLWGLLATLLRFIPYLGPWIAAAFPLALSIAVFPDWWGTVKVGLLFVVMELVGNNVVEPWLYGKRTGLSPVAVIVAAVLWTWLWGVVGLLVAIPMTLVLAVAGRYVPQLAFLDVLFGDEPGLGPEERFYQRLVAADSDEAAKVAEEYLKDHRLEEFYDVVVLPALRAAKHDVIEGRLDAESLRFVRESTRDLVEELSERNGSSKAPKKAATEPADGGKAADEATPAAPPPRPLDGTRLLFVPAGDETEVLAGQMLADVLRHDGIQTRILPAVTTTADMVEAVRQDAPDVVCVGGLPPYAILRARHLCKRLRAGTNGAPVVVALWDAKANRVGIEERMKAACADRVAVSLAQAAEEVRALAAESARGRGSGERGDRAAS